MNDGRYDFVSCGCRLRISGEESDGQWSGQWSGRGEKRRPGQVRYQSGQAINESPAKKSALERVGQIPPEILDVLDAYAEPQ